MPRFSTDDIQLISVDASYDKSTSTQVKETENLLQYESQHFRCKIRLKVQEAMADQDWAVGLIQACDQMYLENKYGSAGSSQWEFHPLKSKRHRVVNDSDGRQYPFYSHSNSKFEIPKGFVQEKLFTLHFEDHFYPTVAWELPYTERQKLTEIIRHQAFWIWLVAIKKADLLMRKETFDRRYDEIHVLKTIRWKYDLKMKMNPRNPMGQRITQINDIQHEFPKVMSHEIPLPLSATSTPHCNAAQSLTWYPNEAFKRPRILVPPRQIIVPWEMWLTDMYPKWDMKVMLPKNCKMVGAWKKDLLIENPKRPTKVPSMTNAKMFVTGDLPHPFTNVNRSNARGGNT